MLSQFDAMRTFLDSQHQIKQQAIEQMFELHLECGLKIDIENHEKIWDLLTPIQLEVSAKDYFESEKDESIAILILFSSKLEQDFLPAIETKQGIFHTVLSGT